MSFLKEVWDHLRLEREDALITIIVGALVGTALAGWFAWSAWWVLFFMVLGVVLFGLFLWAGEKLSLHL